MTDTEADNYAGMIEALNRKLKEQEAEHEKSIKELNLRYATQQQQLMNSEEALEPLKKENEKLLSMIGTLNTELKAVIKAYTKLVQNKKTVNINLSYYFPKLTRAFKSFVARNARDNY